MKKLVILRGPSGTGKSTIAEYVSHIMTPVFEADKFFIYEYEYKFNASLLPVAHQWCKANVERHMWHDMPLAIVSNTSTKLWEMADYIGLAHNYDYEIEIIKSPGPWDAEVLFQRNKHGVPLDVIQKQINRYEPHPDESEWTDFTVFE